LGISRGHFEDLPNLDLLKFELCFYILFWHRRRGHQSGTILLNQYSKTTLCPRMVQLFAFASTSYGWIVTPKRLKLLVCE
jgi:hypothetical protein